MDFSLQPWMVACGLSFLAVSYWIFVFFTEKPVRPDERPEMARPESGDTICIRKWLYDRSAPISPPYNWRSLLPRLAMLTEPLAFWLQPRLSRLAVRLGLRRHGTSDPSVLAFALVSMPLILATPPLIVLWLGNTWAALSVAVWFLGNQHIHRYLVQHPDMHDGMAHFLLVCGFWALWAGNPWVAVIILALGWICRENIGGVLTVTALFTAPWWVALAGASAGIGLLLALKRPPDHHARHSLVEQTAIQTMIRWVKVKGYYSIHWTTIVQPLRLTPLAVIFAWPLVAEPWRWALLTFAAVLFFSLPASGHSRLIAYGWPLFAPFVVALGGPWPWIFAFFGCFWPYDFAMFDESGGKFGGAKRADAEEARRRIEAAGKEYAA